MFFLACTSRSHPSSPSLSSSGSSARSHASEAGNYPNTLTFLLSYSTTVVWLLCEVT